MVQEIRSSDIGPNATKMRGNKIFYPKAILLHFLCRPFKSSIYCFVLVIDVYELIILNHGRLEVGACMVMIRASCILMKWCIYTSGTPRSWPKPSSTSLLAGHAGR